MGVGFIISVFKTGGKELRNACVFELSPNRKKVVVFFFFFYSARQYLSDLGLHLEDTSTQSLVRMTVLSCRQSQGGLI